MIARSPRVLAATAVALLAAAPAAVGGPTVPTTVVVPNANATVQGDNSNGNNFPFSGGSPIRYQQVYASSQFTSFGGPESLTAMSFRPGVDATAGGFTKTLSNVVIRLSTTAAAPDGLSSTFASNVGANVVTVYSGPLTLTSANTAGPGNTRAFDLTVTFRTPFTYNPSAGNLLLDVKSTSNEGFVSGTSFDAVNLNGDSVSRVFNFGDANATTATGGLPTIGLVTQFTYTAVPVPEPAGLLAVGAVAAAGIPWARRRFRR